MSSIKPLLALLIAALSVTTAQAASQIDQVQLACSDTLSIDGTSALSLRCTGNFTLTGQNAQGSITADESLSIWASGQLTFEDVRLSAPLITLSSDTQVSLGADTQLNGSTIALHSGVREVGAALAGAGYVSTESGASLNLASPSAVPEPSVAVLSLTALMLVGLGRLIRSSPR